MSDVYPVVKVAAVQAASVFLDREGSTEKACRLIREAGRNGARVIGFPEGFIPAHPVWYHHHAATGALSNRLAVELFKNSVEIPGPEVDALCAAARDANAYVVIGACEKMPNTTGTMFNSQIYIAPDGRLIGKHQKIMRRPAEIDGEQTKQHGADQRRQQDDAAGGKPGRQARTDGDENREDREAGGDHLLVAAEHVLDQRRHQRERDRADEPEPAGHQRAP